MYHNDTIKEHTTYYLCVKNILKHTFASLMFGFCGRKGQVIETVSDYDNNIDIFHCVHNCLNI